MDRFLELVRRSRHAAIFGPGTAWRKLGNNEVLHRAVGDDFPVLLIPLDREPLEFEPGTRYEFRQEHFGVHAFVSYNIEQGGDSVRGVLALCLLDGNCRAAAEHLIETTRDAHGEIGGLPAKLRVVLARLAHSGSVVVSGVIEVQATHLINAYQLWKITPSASREILKDRRCPLCLARPPEAPPPAR